MQFIGQAAFIIAALLALHWSWSRPAKFGIFIVASGALRFGGRLVNVAGLNDLAALWILVLIIGCVIVIQGQPLRFGPRLTPVSLYITFLLWAALTSIIAGTFVFGCHYGKPAKAKKSLQRLILGGGRPDCSAFASSLTLT